MKKIAIASRLFLLIVLALSLSFQLPAQTTNQEGPIIFSGTIYGMKPSPNDSTFLEVYYPKGTNKKMVRIYLRQNNSFHDTIYGPMGKYLISDGNFPYSLYFIPGKKYGIQYTYNTSGPLLPHQVALSGSDTSLNRYFITKQQEKFFFDPGENKTEIAYTQLLKNWKIKELARIKQFKLPKEIATTETKSVNYEYLFNLFLYTRFHEMRNPSFKPSSGITKQFNINYNNEIDYKLYSDYKALVYEYYSKELDLIEKEEISKDKTFDLRQHHVKLLHKIVPNEFIRNNILGAKVLYDLKTVKDIDAYYQDFTTFYTGNDATVKEEALDAYLRLTQLKPGTPSPLFHDYINYTGGTSSLTDFTGKFVFIDIWATWCGNCWGEFPYIRKMEEKYKNKNIVFVSVSQDTEREKWAQTIEKERLPGIQLLPKDSHDSFFKAYAVYGIPRYILIDPEGKIINYSTPRPSDEEALTELLDSVGL